MPASDPHSRAVLPPKAVLPAEGPPSSGPTCGGARPRDLMLVDLDCFYVSVERVRDPSLEGRIVVVGGKPGERGVVVCASYEARAFGVRAGMPIFQAARRLPPRRTVWLHGDHAAYTEASRKVREVLERFTPSVQPLSLDEALLDFTGCERLHPSLTKLADRIHDEVREATGLPISIGIGSSHTIARVALALAKLGKPGGRSGARLLVPRGEEAAFLAHLPLSFLPGVGPRTHEKLRRFHLDTVGDLAHVPVEILKETFGRVGVTLAYRARGLDGEAIPSRAMTSFGRSMGDRKSEHRQQEQYGADDGADFFDAHGGQKSISRETSFASDVADREHVDAMLSYLAQRAILSLRKAGLRARSVGVRLRYSDFHTVEKRRALPEPSDRDDDILKQVRWLWPRCWKRRVRLRLVGVTLHGLEPVGERQLELFDGRLEENRPRGGGSKALHGVSDEVRHLRRAALDEAIDQVRERHGFGAVTRGRAVGLITTTPGARTHATGTEGGRRIRGFTLRTPSCSK